MQLCCSQVWEVSWAQDQDTWRDGVFWIFEMWPMSLQDTQAFEVGVSQKRCSFWGVERGKNLSGIQDIKSLKHILTEFGLLQIPRVLANFAYS